MLEPSSGLTSSTTTGGAIIWGDPRLLSATAGNGAFIPVLKSDPSGRLVLLYNHVTEPGAPGVPGIENPYYLESADNGKSWQEAEPIYESGTSLKQATFDFDQGGTVHAVWRTQNEIWHSREEQWPISANRITSTVDLVFSPDIAASQDGTLHVVWAQQDDEIHYAQSEDQGESWISELTLTDSGPTNKSDNPAIAADQSGNMHLVWDERIWDDAAGDWRYEVRYLFGTKGVSGIEWNNSPSVLSADVDSAQQPAIVAQDMQVHVAFARRDAHDEQYAYYTMYDTESGWSLPVDVTHDPVTVNSNVPFVLVPALAVCDEAVYIYYHGAIATNSKEILLGSGSTDGWGLVDQVDVGNVRAIRPTANCSGGTIHVAYEKVIHPNVDHQVYYISGSRYAVYLPVGFK